jgi:N6-adenosine-specific RNA methylase IME4
VNEEFSTILIDPPWPERGAGKIKRGADRHYDLLSVADIPRVILTCPLYRPAPNAHLYFWATDNYLDRAMLIMKDIGFRYIRTLPWIKMRDEFSKEAALKRGAVAKAEAQLQIGLGQYFRGASELLLFGVRGKGKEVCTDRRDICNVIIAPRGRHSAKPVKAYERIEARSKGPYLEMFARSNRPGWTSWGNEAPSVGC